MGIQGSVLEYMLQALNDFLFHTLQFLQLFCWNDLSSTLPVLFPRLASSLSFPRSPRASSQCSRKVSCESAWGWVCKGAATEGLLETSVRLKTVELHWHTRRVTLCSRPIRREFERERDVFKRHSSELPLSLKVSCVQSWKMLYDHPWERAQIFCSIWIQFWSCNYWGS